MWSMLEAFRLTALASIIESKSRQSFLVSGWASLQRMVTTQTATIRLASKFKAMSAIESIGMSLSTKFRTQMVSGIRDLQFCKSAWNIDQERRKRAAVLIWNRYYTNMTLSAFDCLMTHKNEVKKRLRMLFRGLLMSLKGRIRDSLAKLIHNNANSRLRLSTERRKTDIVLQIIRSHKSKAFQALRELAVGKMEFELQEGIKERHRLVCATPDMEELDRNHNIELTEIVKNATKAAAIRRFENAVWAKKRYVLNKLTSKLSPESVVDPKLARVWVINLLAVKYKQKMLCAAQILRFPTLARHEKQKASQKLNTVISRNCNSSIQIAFNRILKNKGDFASRCKPILNILFEKVLKNARTSFYAMMADSYGSLDITGDKLAAVAFIARKVTELQGTSDQRLKSPCLSKLGALLDPETSTGAKFQSQAYTFDLSIEKRLKLEREMHPKILSKINAKWQTSVIRQIIGDARVEVNILEKNLENVRESTRRLKLLRENEVKDLIGRKNLGFSYEGELRKLLGDMWGPSKLQKGEQHSLSHNNDGGEHTNKTVILDQSVSKNVELEIEESSPHIATGFQTGRLAVESEYHPVTDSSKSQVTFKLNNSEKLLRELESKKLIKRLKELSFDSLVDHQGAAVDEVLTHLISTKNDLENALDRLVTDFNDLQFKTVEEADKVDIVQSKIQEFQQKKVRFEMKLIDFQDKKGILTLEKSTIGQKNEAIRSDLESIQGNIASLKTDPSLDTSESQKLDKIRNEYFEKHELIQRNSSNLLKLDQELLEVNRTISGMAQQGVAFKTEVASLEEAKMELEVKLATSTQRLNDLRLDVRELISQVAMNMTLIESLEIKKRQIGGTTVDFPNDKSAIEIFARFKDGFFKLNDLKLQKAKLVAAQFETTKELDENQSLYQELNDRMEVTAKDRHPQTEGASDLPEMNIQRKQAAASRDRLARKLSSLHAEVKEVKRSIETESEKLKEFIVDFEESPRKSSESSHEKDNRTDFLSKNSAYMSTRADFATTDFIENSTVRDNLLNLSKSSLADDNVKFLLVSKLNQESRDQFGITDQTGLGTAAFDEALAVVIAKKKVFLQNNQLAFFSFLKKEEIEDRIKGNSCEILDIKEQILAKEIMIKGLRKRMRDLGLKASEAGVVIARQLPRSISKSVGSVALVTTHTQTVIGETLFGLKFNFDNPDELLPRKKGVSYNIDSILDVQLFPKKRERVIHKLDPLIQKKKVNLSNYLEIEDKDLFDGRNDEMIVGAGIKFDLNESGIKDSLILDEYFPADGFKKSVRKLNIRRLTETYLVPRVADNLQSIHDIVWKASPVDPVIRLAPRKLIQINKMAKILSNPNFEDQKTKAANILGKLIPSAIRNATNLNFYHLKLVTSNQKIQAMMSALSRFRIDRLKAKLNDTNSKFSGQSAVALCEAINSVATNHKRRAFQRIHAKLNEVNRYRNWLLSKWMAKGDTNMRKHLRLVVQYWKHIRNDNLWNAKILKTMAIKAPITTQIALWRLMLFKKRQYDCNPKLVKGLLSLITMVDSKQLMRGLKAIQGKERPKNDFDATIVCEKPRKVDASLFQSELVAKDVVDEDFGIKSQRLYSLFTYMGIIQKRAKLQIFYKFLEQVKAEPVRRKLLRFEPKALEPNDDSDSGVRAVKFLLDQQSRGRVELTTKNNLIQDLKDELDEKNENLLFMQAFLLNIALKRTERAMNRVFARNASLAAFQLMETLKAHRVKRPQTLKH